MTQLKIAVLLFAISICLSLKSQEKKFTNTTLPVEERVKDLISRMTFAEKVSQMMNSSVAIPRLGIPEYDWWNEALHGVARSGVATVFPQAIGLGATFDKELIFKVSSAISDEARAMYNISSSKGYRLRYDGLTFWTPNINIFRDPRWGRGQETYGEDPFLTGTLGSAFVKGLQGNNPGFLKVAACAKHYAVHSGPERLRHEFNAVVSDKDMYETYLPAFKALVGAGVESVMGAYNRTNGELCCASTFLIDKVLRTEWGFNGHFVTDCGAVSDFYEGHKMVKDAAEASALAVKRGVNLNCGTEFSSLAEAVKRGLITEAEIDKSLATLLTTRFKLGMFDPFGSIPYDKIKADVINSAAHRALAKEAAIKSVVMLKNNGVLPLKKDLSKYYVTGPNATSIEALIGNYYGVNDHMVTILEGIAGKIEKGSQLQYKPGCLLDRSNINPIDWTTGESKVSDATIVVLGITGLIEGEEGEAIASEHFGDRLDYNLPMNQIDFLKKLRQGNKKPIIAVITGGSPMNLAEVHELADAVLLVWYPGEEGGNAVADIIFGDASPSGKLPITFPKSFDQLPAYEDYSMKGRTYRYMTAEPMYPFGFGLNYASFEYSNLILSKNKMKKQETTTAAVTIKNTGKSESEEVVQLYITHADSSLHSPLFALKDFKRIKLMPGNTTEIKFLITPEMLSIVDNQGKSVVPAGSIKIYVGGSLPGERSEKLGAPKATEAMLTIQ